jgi:hypothetical protein
MHIEVEFLLGIDSLLSLNLQACRGRQVHDPHLRREIAVDTVQTTAACRRQRPTDRTPEVDLLCHLGEPTPYLYRRRQLDLSGWR